MINNRQAGRRRGRGGQQRQQGGGGGRGAESGNRIDNRARGNANQLLEKYKNLAADAQRQGDRVNTEYYLQFADHYFRVLADSRSRFEEQNQRRHGDDGYDDDDGGDDIDGFDMAPQQRRDERDGQQRRDERDRGDGNRERGDRGDRGERQGRDEARGDRQPRRDRDDQPREDRSGYEGRNRDRDRSPMPTEPERADEGQRGPGDEQAGGERTAEPAPRSGRGLRPRRAAAVGSVTDGDEPVKLDLAVLPPPIQLSVEAAADDDAPPPPRRRGRPRKTEAAEQAAE